MRLCRYEKDGVLFHGLCQDDRVTPIQGTFFDGWKTKNEWTALKDVRLLAPVAPGKVVAVGLNYYRHAEEMNMPIPKEPLLFFKANSAVIGPKAAIIKPKQTQELSFEAELAMVVKARCRHVLEKDAEKYILGYTCLNDVTARDIQRQDGQWARCKSFDTFCPIGPVIETEWAADGQQIESYLNGKCIQADRVNRMIFSPAAIFAYVSSQMTLYPGDVITTGTPSGVTTANVGDEIEIRIAGIGRLINRVSEE